jgi:hypothetical protein
VGFRLLLLSVLSAVVAGGCGFKGDYGGTAYQCGAGERCPDGYMCVDGVCAMGSSSDGGIDATPGPDSGPRCGTISLLDDDFGDGVISADWDPFEDTGATVTESGGALRIALAAGSATPYAGIGSDAYYDMRDGAFDVSVAQRGGQTTILEIRDWEGQKAQMVAEGGDLLVAMFDTPSDGIRYTTPYDPVAHRYWRVSADADTMSFEVSANRTSWTLLHAESVALDLAHVEGLLSAGGELAATTTAIFEDVNPTAAPAGFCPAADLADDFAGAPLDPIWQHWNDSGCTVTETGGALQMTFADTGNCVTGVQSYHQFDLRESSFVVDAAGVAGAPNFVAYMQVLVHGAVDDRLEIARDGSTLRFTQLVNGVIDATDSGTYSATGDRWWRIGGHAGRVHLDTSPDGAAWTTRLDAAAGFDVSRVLLLMAAENYGVIGGPVTVTWADLNGP